MEKLNPKVIERLNLTNKLKESEGFFLQIFGKVCDNISKEIDGYIIESYETFNIKEYFINVTEHTLNILEDYPKYKAQSYEITKLVYDKIFLYIRKNYGIQSFCADINGEKYTHRIMLKWDLF